MGRNKNRKSLYCDSDEQYDSFQDKKDKNHNKNKNKNKKRNVKDKKPKKKKQKKKKEITVKNVKAIKPKMFTKEHGVFERNNLNQVDFTPESDDDDLNTFF